MPSTALQFIDTHQHLVYRDHLGYGWTNGIEALAKGDFTLEDYQKLTNGLGIQGTVFMETGVDDGDYQKEARFVAKLIGNHGLMAQIASCRPETAAGFEAWLEECENLNVVGFRRILHVMPDDLSESKTFRHNVKLIGKKSLPFDLCFLARQLPLAEDLLTALPDQIFVLDHCGVPDIVGGAFETWAKHIKRLGQAQNLYCKLSGITAYCAPGTANLETLKPWVDHVLQVFGPNRIIWGGDWPVVNLGSGLPDWIALTRQLLAGLSIEDQMAITGGNAKRVYNL
jgi:predicted TIM-barrel fold metal-dependent hydrolase